MDLANHSHVNSSVVMPNQRQRKHWPAALGRLERLVHTAGVTDVLVNGVAASWAVTDSGMVQVDPGFENSAAIRWAAIWLINRGGKHLDDATPCADVVVDGFRVHAVLPPISGASATISIRAPAAVAPSLTTMTRLGALSGAQANWLRAQVERKQSLLICGGTGTGKTTLLASLMAIAPGTERIITIEDVPELNIAHPHVVSLRTRQANIEGSGEIDAAQLVRESLRMRPDRIVIGECRGAEFRELLTALNTGHAGGAGTLHANGLDDVISRLYILGSLSGIERELVSMLSAAAFDLIIETSNPDGRRLVSGVAALDTTDSGLLSIRRLPW